jgi:hypothetical protein
MNIVRDDRDERETRVDRMIGEFRAAQSRCSRRPTDKAVELKPDASTKAAVTRSPTSH